MGEGNLTPGKMEITIKITEFPKEIETVENGWKQFSIEADKYEVEVKVKPKVFKKLEKAQEEYPQWVAAIVGKIGKLTEKGFILEQPNIQVFERKPKEIKPEEKKESV